MQAKHVVIINTLLLKTMESYINTFVRNSEDAGSISMYAEDVAYAANALVAFNASKDASALHNSIMMQDTLVREYYIDILLYIERNKLINKRDFCCS
jgi:hypothetical protein